MSTNQLRMLFGVLVILLGAGALLLSRNISQNGTTHSANSLSELGLILLEILIMFALGLGMLAFGGFMVLASFLTWCHGLSPENVMKRRAEAKRDMDARFSRPPVRAPEGKATVADVLGYLRDVTISVTDLSLEEWRAERAAEKEEKLGRLRQGYREMLQDERTSKADQADRELLRAESDAVEGERKEVERKLRLALDRTHLEGASRSLDRNKEMLNDLEERRAQCDKLRRRLRRLGGEAPERPGLEGELEKAEMAEMAYNKVHASILRALESEGSDPPAPAVSPYLPDDQVEALALNAVTLIGRLPPREQAAAWNQWREDAERRHGPLVAAELEARADALRGPDGP